jgi:hypothetical protein
MSVEWLRLELGGIGPMKRFTWVVAVMLMAMPAWAAKKVTVQQLRDMLVEMQQAKKTDEEVASALKQVVLSEELTRSTMNSLVGYVPGKYSTEQIYVLEARSVTLPPPADDLPNAAAPDDATQKAMLDKAADFAVKTYGGLPHLVATRTMIRFQDHVDPGPIASGLHSGAVADAGSNPNLVAPNQFVHYINSTEAQVDFVNGAEKNPLPQDKGQWGANGMLALMGQAPVLSTVFAEAQKAGKIRFLRWEIVNGKQAAVFAFNVDKKNTHYAVMDCCFPDVSQSGIANFSSASRPGGGGVKGNLQTSTSYNFYKTTVPYHGEIFINPETGIVVRLITQAEFKNSDVVHQEDQRIDYGPMTVGDKMLVVPVRSVINVEDVPGGDSGAANFSLRHTFFTAEYKDFHTAS